MKKRIIISGIFFLFFSGCYTFEFHPVQDYPNLRKNKINNVLVTTIRPDEGYITLGTLIVHDFSGNILDPSFHSAIKRESKKRGAEGAWISKIKLKKTVRIQGGAPNSSNYMQNNYYNQSQIEGTIGIVEIILFNYQSLKSPL